MGIDELFIPPDVTPFVPATFYLTAEQLEIELSELRLRHQGARNDLKIERIGDSQEGRPVWGLEIGRGQRTVSLVAGAHADEPVGPVTAFSLARALLESDAAGHWLNTFRFLICPQINPDGAERNRTWFDDPIDPLRYFRHVLRELPGEDIEFGYPRIAGTFDAPDDPAVCRALPPLRPENKAVANFLKRGAPFAYHASLHGMGFSEGAWFLIGESWASRAGPLMDRIARAVAAMGWPVHDVDRKGEKGFRRLDRGFSTTPNHVAMRRYFLDAGDTATADLFHPSSMEYVCSLGGDPLVMVSELPLFRLAPASAGTDPAGGETPYARFLAAMRQTGRLAPDDTATQEERRRLFDAFGLTVAPLREQVRLQAAMIFEALAFLETADPLAPEA